MRDPREGRSPEGLVVTGARRDRVPPAFEPVLSAATRAMDDGASLYLYGSVATGTAVPGRSDVDLVAVGVPDEQAAALGAELSARFSTLCRGVTVGVSRPDELTGDSDAAYGNRVFLRHYCVWLAGPDPRADLPPCPADRRAARGFNGDIGLSLARWRRLVGEVEPGPLGRRVARKSLFAVAGLVSLHDSTWTTDRVGAARRWAHLHPGMAGSLQDLQAWSQGHRHPDGPAVTGALEGVVPAVVAQFSERIGLWPDPGPAEP
ncbi:nucleotidyltransferase domain-containing protein [Ornithinimicrobium sediminis]|uniref:nucleotidyltransferase domain-containing protein n=1 Tax=Ornithinimicrobium sediminis TaxID=2904603 RepID=UPI001E5EECA6|nr:nucleotidyltransferase domain-containing protein [Ornithinimicrobium sediminis]